MKKVLIAGGLTTQNYAPVAADLTTANAATNITLLPNGALAIYGFVDAGGGSINSGAVGKEVLITESTNSADAASATAFVAQGNETITIAQGGVLTPVQVYGINRRGVRRVTKQAYVAPVKEVSFIGFNGVVGSIGMPTVTQGSEATLLAVQQEASTADQIRSQEDYGLGNIAASTAEYDVLAGVVTNINTAFTKTHTAFIVSNGTRAVTTTATGVLTLTKDSNVLSFVTAIPAAGGWSAAIGQLVSIANLAEGAIAVAAASNVNGTVYRIVGTTATTLILDRPYRGETATISQANVQAGHIALLTGTTAWGIKLVVDNPTRVYNYAVQGLLVNASITTYYTGVATGTQMQAPSKGLGAGAAVVAIEEGLIAYRGQLDTVDRRMKQLPRYANSAATYTAYNIQFTMSTQVTGAPHNKSENSSITIFVPSGQSTFITAFEAILKALVPVTQATYNF